MRLIDADELFHEYLENELWNIPDIVYSTLLKQPTVEAIPIEYVKEHIRMFDVLSNTRVRDVRWGDIYNTFSQVLRLLIANWEEEKCQRKD